MSVVAELARRLGHAAIRWLTSTAVRITRMSPGRTIPLTLVTRGTLGPKEGPGSGIAGS